MLRHDRDALAILLDGCVQRLELVLDCTVAPVDETPPELSLLVDDEPNADGWTSRVVQVSAEALDEGSGVASITLVVNGVDTDS